MMTARPAEASHEAGACRAWNDRLLDYALCALSASVVSQVETHLKTCPNCTAALADLRARRAQLDTALAQLVAGAEPSPALRARVLAAVEVRPPTTPWGSAWVGVLAAGATVLVLGFTLPPLAERWIPAAPQAVSISDWRSPTESLLRSPAANLLEAPPRLGEFYFPLVPAPPRTGARKGGNDES